MLYLPFWKLFASNFCFYLFLFFLFVLRVFFKNLSLSFIFLSLVSVFSSFPYYCSLSLVSSCSFFSFFSLFFSSTSLILFCYLLFLHCLVSHNLFFLDLRVFCIYFVLLHFLVVMFFRFSPSPVFLSLLCLFQPFAVSLSPFLSFSISLCSTSFSFFPAIPLAFLALHHLFFVFIAFFFFSPLRSPPFSWTHFVMIWKSLVFLDFSFLCVSLFW